MSTASASHAIGHAQNTPTSTQLLLFFNPQQQRFRVGAHNIGAAEPYMWGAFATLQQMQLHYMEHPLSRMGNQPLHYHNDGFEHLRVTKIDDTSLLFAIQYPPTLAVAAGVATKPFIVKHEDLKANVIKLRRGMLALA